MSLELLSYPQPLVFLCAFINFIALRSTGVKPPFNILKHYHFYLSAGITPWSLYLVLLGSELHSFHGGLQMQHYPAHYFHLSPVLDPCFLDPKSPSLLLLLFYFRAHTSGTSRESIKKVISEVLHDRKCVYSRWSVVCLDFKFYIGNYICPRILKLLFLSSVLLLRCQVSFCFSIFCIGFNFFFLWF